MSHLACADEPWHPLNARQLRAFERAAIAIKQVFPAVRLSLANSSGIFLGGEWHFDLVRPGASLYGVNPQPEQTNPMRQVIHLQLPVLQLRSLSESTAIGYGATQTLSPPDCMAVVAGGYADGLHRTIGRQGEGMIDGVPVPVVGRISMDTTAFNLSELPQSPDSIEGLYIDVVNSQLTVDLLARRTGALGYEVLTSLGGRYRRQYLVAEAGV
jgi:alanine racemase